MAYFEEKDKGTYLQGWFKKNFRSNAECEMYMKYIYIYFPLQKKEKREKKNC